MKVRGFSLIEILVALLLVISISLALLKQQWQINRFRIQIQRQNANWLSDSNQREQGMTILECLLGLALSLSILAILLQQYVQIKQQTYLAVQAMTHTSRLQTILSTLRRKGHHAGFAPCLPIADLNTFDHRTGQSLQPLEIQKQPTTKLSFFGMSPRFLPVLPAVRLGKFKLLRKWGVSSKHPVIIADCQQAEVLDTYHIVGHTLQFNKALRFTYHHPIYIGEWLSESFSIKKNAQGQYSLFYTQNHHSEELEPDIGNMQWALVKHRSSSVLRLNLEHAPEKPFLFYIRMYHL